MFWPKVEYSCCCVDANRQKSAGGQTASTQGEKVSCRDGENAPLALQTETKKAKMISNNDTSASPQKPVGQTFLLLAEHLHLCCVLFFGYYCYSPRWLSQFNTL